MPTASRREAHSLPLDPGKGLQCFLQGSGKNRIKKSVQWSVSAESGLQHPGSGGDPRAGISAGSWQLMPLQPPSSPSSWVSQHHLPPPMPLQMDLMGRLSAPPFRGQEGLTGVAALSHSQRETFSKT